MLRFLVVLAALTGLAAGARADFVLTMERKSQTTVDSLLFTGLNNGPEEITGLSLTIGDMSKNFDYARITTQSSGLGITLLSPDTLNNAGRSDVLEWSFTGFTRSRSFGADIDIDRDTGSATVDWQTTLFNNGSLANAQLTVHWAAGPESSVILPDSPGRNVFAPYTLSVSPSRAVPGPASLPLLLLGGIGSACVWRRKRQT
ncbi:MAG: hypothetical protein JWM56_744 [Candidatus Peribacteria bacterium]|nr:hypothetical protein [Candidatus Peribacteria bacterium]